MAYYNYQQQRPDYMSDPMAALILQKLYNGLVFGALTAFLMVILIDANPALAVTLMVVAFIAEIIAIIGYFFAKKETTIERLYYTFVASSSALLGVTIYVYVWGGALDIVLGAFGLTALTVAYVYNQARVKQPNLQQLGSKLFPLSIAFIAILLVSWFVVFSDIFMLIFSAFGVALFSLYLYYDFARIMQGQVDSPARSAWRLYWDILLIFRYMLQLLTYLSRMNNR